ncbi:hypothetical protein [Corynebacterium amycolatum]|uniref:hypothetical protein n=1 Tax=Corynebacterium amycolatum TaxID=43765 RepID=UPI003EE30B14
MSTPSAPNSSGPLSTSQVLDAVAQFEALSTVIVENFEVLAPDHAHDAYKSIEKARKRLAVIDATYVETMKGADAQRGASKDCVVSAGDANLASRSETAN